MVFVRLKFKHRLSITKCAEESYQNMITFICLLDTPTEQ